RARSSRKRPLTSPSKRNEYAETDEGRAVARTVRARFESPLIVGRTPARGCPGDGDPTRVAHRDLEAVHRADIDVQHVDAAIEFEWAELSLAERDRVPAR